MSANESRPAGAASELIAASKISLPPQTDIQASQLSRIETILNRILDCLASLVAAR